MKSIIVYSGKGGVGKTTTTANIARSLLASGHKVFILDADVNTPSMHVIFEQDDLPENLVVRSIGYESAGLIYIQNSMVKKYLSESKRMVWKFKPDYLLIDTPPSITDIHTNLISAIDISGVLLVTQPNKLSVTDVNRTSLFFQAKDIPILGIVENMSQGETVEYPVPILGKVKFTSSFDPDIVWQENVEIYNKISGILSGSIEVEQNITSRTFYNESITAEDIDSMPSFNPMTRGFQNVATWDHIVEKIFDMHYQTMPDEFLTHCSTEKIARLLEAFKDCDTAHFMITKSPGTEIKLIAGEIGEASLVINSPGASYYGVPRIKYKTAAGDVTVFPFECMPVDREELSIRLNEGGQITTDGRYLPSKGDVEACFHAFGDRIGLNANWEKIYDEAML
jgi:MinD superfamily P-loop ATPase